MKMSSDMNKLPEIVRKKKAQVGGTLTWFVATIIIIVILLIAIYAASILGKGKSVGDVDVKEITGEEEKDWEDVKNEVAFEKNSTNKERIQKWLNNKTLADDE